MSSKDKGRRKHGKSHKNTSEPGSSTHPAIPIDEEPENLGFCYTIDGLETKYGKDKDRILTVGNKGTNDIARFWFPPIHQDQFRRRSGKVYRWPGEDESELVQCDRKSLKRVEVASVFFQAKQDNFLAVFKDCTKYNISEEDFGWSQISFHHHGNRLSEVDIGGSRPLLAAPADGSSWMPQVVPEVYNYDMKNPSAKNPGPSGGLCGKLSLLIAMAAFSAPVEHAEDIVAKCFGLHNWELHGHPIGRGRYQERGVVVSIYLDPEAVGITHDHLKAFEDGKYGPIFSSPSPQVPGYTHHAPAIPIDYTSDSPTMVPRTFNPPYQIPTAPNVHPAYVAGAADSAYSSRMLQPSTNLYTSNDEEDNEPDEEEEQ